MIVRQLVGECRLERVAVQVADAGGLDRAEVKSILRKGPTGLWNEARLMQNSKSAPSFPFQTLRLKNHQIASSSLHR